MLRNTLSCGALAILAIAVACSDQSANPTSPSLSSGGSAMSATQAAANADGSLLKVSAPAPRSPIGGTRLESGNYKPTLTAGNSEEQYSAQVPLTYRFQVFNEAGTMVEERAGIAEGSSGATSYSVVTELTVNKTFTWRVRAEYSGEAGPWSASASFMTPAEPVAPDGYLSGSELYDPLTNGTTVGTVHGPVTFVPGLGVKLESQLSYISYELPQTLTQGEFSIICTNLSANTEGNKTKLFAMGSGYGDIVTNDRRMTVEKRGDPAGVIAWRFITHDDQVDTEGSAERRYYNFQPNLTYFWEASWRNNFFNVLIREDSTTGVNGSKIYEMGKPFDGPAYDPNPHVIYIGAPVGRSGPEGASVDQVIIRQVWVSSRPRPAFANK
jgi:hypothetical protein